MERVLFCLAQSAKGVIVYILAKQSWSEKTCKCYNVQLPQKGCVLLICPCLLIEWKGYFSKKHFWSAMGMRLPHTVEPGGCFFRECPPGKHMREDPIKTVINYLTRIFGLLMSIYIW